MYGESVPVAIWRVSALEERSLDIYEGFPTPRYIQTCRDDYEDFGFDVAVLDKALVNTKPIIQHCTKDLTF